MNFENFVKNQIFYTKDGMHSVLSKDEDAKTIEACITPQYFHWLRGDKHFVDVVVFEEKDFENCRLCNTFL